MKELFVPALGMAMEECTLVEWLKQPGDHVEAGEEIALIETDKATMELEAPVTGRLGPHLFEAGATVPVGETVAHVLEGDEDESAIPEAVAAASTGGRQTTPSEHEEAPARSGVERSETPESRSDDARTPHALSPRQRRLAAERGEQGEAATDGAERYRAAVGDAVAESWRTIPHFGVTSHIRAEVLMATMLRVRADLERVSVTDLLLRALALALAEHGRGGGSLGLAVATDKGVSIPVLSNVASLSLAEVSEARVDAVERARSSKMSEVDGTAPEFSLSNLGGHDVEHFTGIIPVQQRGLLTVGKVKQRAVVADGVLAAMNTFYATLNVDHRFLDGLHAAAILDGFAAIVNDPARLMGR